MAAIGPHLEQYESTDEELEFFNEGPGSEDPLRGLHGLGAAKAELSTEEIVARAHVGLLRQGINRQYAYDLIAKANLQAVFEENGDAFIEIDQPVGEGYPWNLIPRSSRGLRRQSLFTWTSKMGAPSFSLPAGPTVIGGGCPSAVAGQTIVNPADRSIVAVSALIKKYTGRQDTPESPLWLAEAVCQHCYATQLMTYQYTTQQIAQVMRFEWTKRALATPGRYGSNHWVDVMIEAVERANYKLKDEPERFMGYRYFRIHDSGDMYSVSYLAAWKEVANAFVEERNTYPVLFWAPSRMWAVPKWVDWVNEINTPARNLIIRPSAYHVNSYCPDGAELGTGWAKGTTVTATELIEQMQGATFDFNCPAYDSDDDKVTCRAGKGCRACWVNPEVRVNYRLH